MSMKDRTVTINQNFIYIFKKCYLEELFFPLTKDEIQSFYLK